MRNQLFKSPCIWLLSILFTACGNGTDKGKNETLKGAFEDKFLIGVALNEEQINGTDNAVEMLIVNQFNSIVAENCMKAEKMHPAEEKYIFDLADKFVELGERNQMFIVGHTLIWHSQLPAWFTIDKDGGEVSKDVLIERMREHIHTIVGRYKGRVHGWDVVNEAILDDGTFRQTPFYRIIGEDFIKLAFEFTHQADPDAELYYNDYSTDKPAKRDAIAKLVRSLKEQGVRIDGVGMQGHSGMDHPLISEFEQSIEMVSAEGVKIMITEFDISVLPNGSTGAELSDTYAYSQRVNPYVTSLPDDVAKRWDNRMEDLFRLFLKHHDKISRVTMWGVSDGDSWKNNWPIVGRTDYPLLFDRNYNAKPVVSRIIELAKNETLK